MAITGDGATKARVTCVTLQPAPSHQISLAPPCTQPPTYMQPQAHHPLLCICEAVYCCGICVPPPSSPCQASATHRLARAPRLRLCGHSTGATSSHGRNVYAMWPSASRPRVPQRRACHNGTRWGRHAHALRTWRSRSYDSASRRTSTSRE